MDHPIFQLVNRRSLRSEFEEVRISLIVWMLVLLFAAVIALAPLPSAAMKSVERTVRIEASSFKYEPATITVNLGDQVNLELASTDVVHGLYIDGYDLELISEPGQTAKLAFTAEKPGSFQLRCSVTCGDLHPFMIGKLRVGKNELLWRAVGLSLLAVLSGALIYHQSVQQK